MEMNYGSTLEALSSIQCTRIRIEIVRVYDLNKRHIKI